MAAVSTYSAVPTPRFDWDEGAAKYALCFFPAVGAVCGAALWGWHALCLSIGADSVLFAVTKGKSKVPDILAAKQLAEQTGKTAAGYVML